MTIVRSGAELLAALNRVVEERVDAAVVQAQTEVTTFAHQTWAKLPATWVHPDPYWTGQYRASITVSIGGRVGAHVPTHPEVLSGAVEWPEHPSSPYQALTEADVRAALASLQPYQTVFLSNDAPHAGDVEAHARPMAAAVQFTKAHFGPGYSWGNSLIPGDIPF